MPFDKTIRETRSKLLQVLDESGLHIDILDMMLELLYLTVHRQADEAYKSALKEGGDKSDGVE